MRGGRWLLSLGLLLATSVADAQPRVPQMPPRMRRPQPMNAPSPQLPASPREHASDLRELFGVGQVARLAASSDPEERRSAIARAAAIGSAEALAIIAPQEPLAFVRDDSRAWLDLARALSSFVDQDNVQKALVALVTTAPARPRGATDETETLARIALARDTAALALASSRDPHAVAALALIAAGAGVGRDAAANALIAYPPSQIANLVGEVSTPATFATFLARLGDLRALDRLRALAESHDARTRAAALVALAEMGDGNVANLARTVDEHDDTEVRVAAAVALVTIGASDAARACESLISDERTTIAGITLADKVTSDGILHALAARAVASGDTAIRVAVIHALGHVANEDALAILEKLLADESLRGDAADALARSPSPRAMRSIEKIADTPNMRRVMTRAYVVRRILRGEKSHIMDRTIRTLMASDDVNDRALATFARVAFDDESGVSALSSRKPEIRRAAVMGSLARHDATIDRALLRARNDERDPTTRELLAIGLRSGDPDGTVTTSELTSRVAAGRSDSALAAFALAAREEGSRDHANDDHVADLLASNDVAIRTHAARGLAKSRAHDATGRLAIAYEYEPHEAVRQAEIESLGARTEDADAPLRTQALTFAARLDPSATIRQLATRALEREIAIPRAATSPQIVWLRATRADGGPTSERIEGSFLTSDGWQLPIAFDADGYALVPGVAPGEGRLLLAPEVPAYEATSP